MPCPYANVQDKGFWVLFSLLGWGLVNFASQQTILFDDLWNIGIKYGPLDYCTFSRMLLFGSPNFSDDMNSSIIYAVIKFIESTNRLSGSIYD